MDELPPEFDRPFTAREFLDVRADLPDAGQWAELSGGRVDLLPAPTTEESDVVGNLSVTISEFVTQSPGIGMPLFRKPLQLSGDTVRSPAMSWVDGAASFAAIDAAVLSQPPAWVVEQVGNRLIRERATDRVRDYLAWGVRLVWIIDPQNRTLFAVTGSESQQVDDAGTIAAAPVVPAFSVTMERLLRPPKGWERPPRPDGGRPDSNGEA